MSQMKVGQFTSASTKGDVYLGLGFIPDFAIVLNDVGTAPTVDIFLGTVAASLMGAKHIHIAANGTITLEGDAADTIVAYAGGDKMSETVAQVATDDPKYVDPSGALYGLGKYTAAGLWISDEYQVNSGKNIVIAFQQGN